MPGPDTSAPGIHTTTAAPAHLGAVAAPIVRRLGAAAVLVASSMAGPSAWQAGVVAPESEIRQLGETDDPAARDRLLRELDQPASDATLDAAIHALARLGEARARARVTAVGVEAVATRSGNTTHEQARRMGAVAFYQLALSIETLGDGLAMLRQLALRDQEDTAAWAVQTLCERATRRPEAAAALDAQRRTLAAELERLGVGWNHLTRGAFPCRRD